MSLNTPADTTSTDLQEEFQTQEFPVLPDPHEKIQVTVPDQSDQLTLLSGDVIHRSSSVSLVVGTAYGGQWVILWRPQDRSYTCMETADLSKLCTEATRLAIHRDPFDIRIT